MAQCSGSGVPDQREAGIVALPTDYTTKEDSCHVMDLRVWQSLGSLKCLRRNTSPSFLRPLSMGKVLREVCEEGIAKDSRETGIQLTLPVLGTLMCVKAWLIDYRLLETVWGAVHWAFAWGLPGETSEMPMMRPERRRKKKSHRFLSPKTRNIRGCGDGSVGKVFLCILLRGFYCDDKTPWPNTPSKRQGFITP